MTEAFSPRRVKPGWLTGPKHEPAGLDFWREVPTWELLPIVERVTDQDYRRGPPSVWMMAERVRG